MRTLHLYLTRQVLVTLVMTVAVFTFVLMLGSVLKEVLGLLVNRQAGPWLVVQSIGLLIPFVLVFALPMGMLTATLLVFGRFSADQELTAVRASGVSLVALITPVLLLSVGLSGVAAFINMQIAPQCRVAYLNLLYRVGMAQAGSFIPERTYIKDFPGSIIYVNKVRGSNLTDVLVYTLNEEKVDSYVRAESGTYLVDRANNVIHVWLQNGYRVGLEGGDRLPQPEIVEEIEFTYTNVAPRLQAKVNLSDMTYWQLNDLLADLEESLSTPVPLGKLPTEELRAKMRQVFAQRKADITMPVRVQIHRQISFSFACIGFTLVGIPLGIRAHRRETTFGIAMALILVLVYYSFIVLGQALVGRPELAPHLILWLPNFIFQAVGIVLLWRANRGV